MQQHLIQQGVRQFMTTAGLPVDKFTAEQACLYTGLQLEEMAEKIQVIAGGTITEGAREMLTQFAAMCDALGKEFKKGNHVGDIMRADHVDLIDADCDLAFVSIGALYSTASNGDGALDHVCATNLAKFPNGQVIRDANGKIMKPAGWTSPNLLPFVDHVFLAARNEPADHDDQRYG